MWGISVPNSLGSSAPSPPSTSPRRTSARKCLLQPTKSKTDENLPPLHLSGNLSQITSPLPRTLLLFVRYLVGDVESASKGSLAVTGASKQLQARYTCEFEKLRGERKSANEMAEFGIRDGSEKCQEQ